MLKTNSEAKGTFYMTEKEEIEERIENIIKDKSLNVSTHNLQKYLDFIKANIKLPYKVTGIESDFTYSDYGDKTPDGNQFFEIIGYEENVAEFSNLFVKVKCLESEEFSLQLFEFKSLEPNTNEGKILSDYTYWIEEYL